MRSLSVTAAKIANGTLTNTQIASSAAIAYSKLATLNTGQILAGNAGTPTAVTLSGDATINGSGVLTIANGAIDSGKIANGTIDNVDIASNAGIAYGKLATLNTGQILAGNGGTPTAVTLSGDATIDSAGVLTIANGAITNTKIASNAAIAYSKLATLNTGQIIVGSGGTPTAVTLGGDATIDAAGALTIANNAITTAKIANSQITTGKLASGAVPTVIGSGTGATNTTNNATTFQGPFGGSFNAASDATARATLPTSGTLSNLNVTVSSAPGSGRQWVVTVFKNGVASGTPANLSCTINGTTATTCSDSANSISYAAGDTMSVQIVPSGTPAATVLRWTAKLSTP